MSDLITLPATGRIAGIAKDTLQVIDQVHLMPPNVRPIAVQVVPNAKYEGALKPREWIIQMRSSTAFPRSTLAHEVGHYVEHQVLGGIGESFKHPAFQGWKDAIQRTDTFRRVYLNYMQRRDRYSAYLMQPYEIFARSCRRGTDTAVVALRLTEPLADFRANRTGRLFPSRGHLAAAGTAN